MPWLRHTDGIMRLGKIRMSSRAFSPNREANSTIEMEIVMTSVGLVVNTYERTYRDVLTPGFFANIAESNRHAFDESVALINNVDDPADAQARAEAMLEAGEITAFYFVQDLLPAALRHARLGPRVLRTRPYLLDYGLVMPDAITTEWLLGWDAEARLDRPVNWIRPSIDLMTSDSRIFHASLNWHPLDENDPGLVAETVDMCGDFSLNYGFSDQLFLVQRQGLKDLKWRTFSPAAIARHAPHPYTFEFRVESYQRAMNLYRATLSTVTYSTSTSEQGVIERTNPSWRDRATLRLIRSIEHHAINRIPRTVGPRWSK